MIVCGSFPASMYARSRPTVQLGGLFAGQEQHHGVQAIPDKSGAAVSNSTSRLKERRGGV